MLTRPQVQRYAAESGLRDIMIAEKEVMLTFLLQLLSERGVNPAYAHDWNPGDSEIKLQISRRETPTLPVETKAQIEQSYFAALPFGPADIACLAFDEVIAEKLRACYQRNKARDIYDLGMFATKEISRWPGPRLERPLAARTADGEH